MIGPAGHAELIRFMGQRAGCYANDQARRHLHQKDL